uniref:Uncharacterized protein n=1 Tax=Arundo donax TaxID=35708 RepID=A0A0A9A486_ARUDO
MLGYLLRVLPATTLRTTVGYEAWGWAARASVGGTLAWYVCARLH